MDFYDYSVHRPDGSELQMREFEGKVILVVNTATGCGFTPQYEDLVAIYKEFHDRGFEILDIPCNQFRGQTPGSDEEVAEFCQLNFGTPWQQMRKSDVIGETKLPLFAFLIEQQGFKGFGKGAKALAMSLALKAIDRNYKTNAEVKWNFTKFLISRNGEVIARFEPTEPMSAVRDAIAAQL